MLSILSTEQPQTSSLIEIDLSRAVAFRQTLRVLIFVNLAFLSLGLTGLQGQLLQATLNKNDVVLFVLSLLSSLLLVALNILSGEQWRLLAVYGAILILESVCIYFSFAYDPALPDDGKAYEVIVFAVPSILILGALLSSAPFLILDDRLREAWALAVRRSERGLPYWRFVFRNAQWTLSHIVIALLVLVGVVLLAVLPLFIGVFLLPSMAVIRVLWSILMGRLSRTLPWSCVAKDRSVRPTCLYLRSFWDDDLLFGPQSFIDFFQRCSNGREGLEQVVGVVSAYVYMTLIRFLFERKQGVEEIVVQAVWASYAVVAIGHSSAGDPPMAAVRFSLEDNDWQTVARRLVEEAQLVVLLAGYTPGVRWEHEHLGAEGFLKKTLLLFPSEDASNRLDRWRALMGDGLQELGPRDADIVLRTIACIWTNDGRRIHLTSRSKMRVAYDLVLRLACAPSGEVLGLARS